MARHLGKENIIVSGRGCGELAKRVSEITGIPYIQLNVRKFPDNELYVRLPKNVSGKKAILFSCLGKRPNEGLIEVLFSLEALDKYGASEKILVLPYMPYARQDDIFSPGEIVSIKVLDKIFSSFGVRGIVTVDMHLHRFKSIKEVFGETAVNTSVMPEIALYVAQHHGTGLQVVAPDEEAEQWARIISQKIGVDYIVLQKERRGDEEVEISIRESVGRKVLIVDDIISTGTTISEAAKKLRSLGAEKVIVACAHALLVSDAEGKIFNSGVSELIASDTIVNPYMKVSAANAIVRGLNEVIA